VPRHLCALAEAFDEMGVLYATRADPDGETRERHSMIGARIALFPASHRVLEVAIAGQTAPGGGITLRDQPLIVAADDVVNAREVTVGQKLGTWSAVQATDPSRPLTAADRVVVRGLQRCREGKPVKPTAAADASLDVASLVAPQPRSDPAAVSPPPKVPVAEPEPPAAAEPLPAPGEAPR
jgi:hypothetical protein